MLLTSRCLSYVIFLDTIKCTINLLTIHFLNLVVTGKLHNNEEQNSIYP